MQLEQVTRRDRAPGEQVPGVHAPLIQQFAQLVEVHAGLDEVGQPIQGGLVALVGQGAQGFPVEVRSCHGAMLHPCPRGKVKCEHGRVLTIGQLAGHVGVSTKTIRPASTPSPAASPTPPATATEPICPHPTPVPRSRS
ncbi:hypothetical protein UO65_4776 [Actinokineospora spheciospongiae]|uniref:Uncharacterized protein n=1 Tax=Actinokineospora spheciospongiae TaxID=909613 RepID=W7IU60_9PSEU|nr:hypothetical protein UO65_4776 [Actinokineospora spheciospongiae]